MVWMMVGRKAALLVSKRVGRWVEKTAVLRVAETAKRLA
jgi:hypothetical protein